MDSYIIREHDGSTFSESSAFYITDDSSSLGCLFRILSGSCDIESATSGLAVAATQNFFFGDFRENQSRDMSFLDSFEENLNLSDYEKFLSENKFSQRKFYTTLRKELTTSVFNEIQNNYTASFVHIYRAYEHLSYAFPMIYASKTHDYIGTFENLRKWMTSSSSDDHIGELRFHSKFITTLFAGTPESDSTIDIHIQTRSEFQNAIFDGLTSKILGWKSEEKWTASTQKPNKISVSFLDFHSFLVTLRNRYFHYSNARKDNLDIDNLIDPELLFSFINKPALNFISSLFYAIVKHQYLATQRA